MAERFQFEDFKPAVSVECRHCEELVADAVDDLLSAADQVFFDRHISSCAHCMAALADARRGAAWLEMMRTPRPEPSAELLERIILATSGAATSGRATSGAALGSGAHPLPAAELPEFDLLTAGSVYRPTLPAFAPGVLPFRPRLPQVAPRWKGMSGLNRLLFEPRLAMTAAMAFFSIALTLNLAGAHLKELRARDLTHDLGPAGLRRSYYEATASVTRRYEGLRVVHTVESRLDDLRQDDLRQDDLRQDEQDSGSRPDSAVPESRRDLPASPATAPAQPADAPARPQPAPAEPKQAAPQGSGVSLRARPQAEPLHLSRFLPVAERKLNQIGANDAITLTHKEGGLA